MTARATTAAQLAGLLGVPKSTVIRRAQAEGWAYTEEAGRGGMRRLYTVDGLPAALRAKLLWSGAAPAGASADTLAAGQAGRAEAAKVALRSGLEERAASTRRQVALRQADELPAAAQTRMDARLAVVRAYEMFSGGLNMPAVQARLLFAQMYNRGELVVPAPVRAELPSTSDSSIERWQRDIRTRGITALAGAYGNRAGAGKVDSQPELRQFVQAMLVTYPHARATHVMKGLQVRFAGVADLPSARSLERWISDWRRDNAEALASLGNPDAWKNKFMTAFGSQSEGIVRLNQRWELDSSPADVMCSDGRYALIGGIDVFSRRAKLLVAKTSKAIAVAALLRAMLLDFGAPEEAKTDNGSDYVSDHVVRVLTGLDVTHTLCDPFSPWQKPHIERFFGTFSRDLVELLPGYIGHSVAERNAIEARKSFADRLMKRGEVVELRMTGVELQAFCDEWADNIYHQRPHEGLSKRTPFEVAVAWPQAEVVRIGDERALDVLLADAPENNGRRVVQKKGIRVDDAWFIAAELGESWVGESVHVRYDVLDHDLGTLFVFGHVAGMGTETFICRAYCPERSGMDRREIAARARALQIEHRQQQRKVMRSQAKRAGVDEIVDIIRREAAQAAGKLRVLPTRKPALHASAGLAAAADAARAAAAPQRTTADIEQLAEVQAARLRIVAEQAPKGTPNAMAEARGPQPTPVFESVAQRVQWLLRQHGVRALSTEEQDTLATYRRAQPASYRRMSDIVAESKAAAEQAAQEKPAVDRIAGDSTAV